MDFEDIRPYRDHEVPEKLAKLLDEPHFQKALSAVHSEIPFQELKKKLLNIRTVKELQSKMILPSLEVFIQKSMDSLKFNGLNRLSNAESYLFVSTHRDIVLDSALMNYILVKHGFNTAEIAIGDNLLSIPWVVDLVKLNKTFIVKRSLPKEEKLNGSMQLSAYINHTLRERNESIWIAQRSGRSKDGKDQTNPSLLKMFYLAEKDQSILEHIRSLNICPVSISYEYNPCDILVLPELIQNQKGEQYAKAPMEDVTHMLTGIQGYKGKVVVSFGKPINQYLDQLSGIKNRNAFFNALAAQIDTEIYRSYHLMPTNYIAADLLDGSSKHKAYYEQEERDKFVDYMENRLAKVDAAPNLKRELFLTAYANPVRTAESLDKS